MNTNILKELEAMRQRQIDMINSEYDSFRNKLELIVGDSAQSEESVSFLTLPLRSGSGVFKGKKPVYIDFGNSLPPIPAMTWKQVVNEIFKDVVKDNNRRRTLRNLCGKINGKKRMILSTSPQGMTSPIKVADDLFFESHYDTESLIKILITRILVPINYDFGSITVTVRD